MNVVIYIFEHFPDNPDKKEISSSHMLSLKQLGTPKSKIVAEIFQYLANKGLKTIHAKMYVE